MNSRFVLTEDQQTGFDGFNSFILDPNESVFVLSGYSGTGKTTLVKELIDYLPQLKKMLNVINPGEPFPYDVKFTATTNKAAENFAKLSGEDVKTIHSELGLRVRTDYKNNSTHLVVSRPDDKLHDTILFIDEASYIDASLLKKIFDQVVNCKIVFIGDPAQLIQFNATNAPAFSAGYKEVQLSEVVRQAEGNPIVDLSTKFRHTVNTGEFFSFVPDGFAIKHLPRDQFDQAIINEMSRPDWKYDDSKVLAWTNKTVINYNHGIRNISKGNPEFEIGDYAVCNQYVQVGNNSLKTDQLVHITDIGPTVTLGYRVTGKEFEIANQFRVFMPDSLEEHKRALKEARKAEDWGSVKTMTDGWIDLRAAYSCTINKSQGSTYDQVFIDLDDIKRCNNPNQIARMLYVAVSRARNHVTFTGDLV